MDGIFHGGEPGILRHPRFPNSCSNKRRWPPLFRTDQAWLRRFPDFHALAAASESEVLQAWEGLGYYSRARNLHATARKISRDHGGRCPGSINKLMALPGIGRYTAHAVLTFAGDEPVSVLSEANIARLTARVFNVTAPIDSAAGRERSETCH